MIGFVVAAKRCQVRATNVTKNVYSSKMGIIIKNGLQYTNEINPALES